MDGVRGVVVHEAECPVEGWDDPIRGKVLWRTLLSGDRTPTSGLTLGVTDLGPGQPSPFHPHRHAQSEAYYVLSGEGIVHIAGEEHALRAGTSVFIPGGEWHGARNTGREPLRLLYVFAADSFGEVHYVFPEPDRQGGLA
ncbi:MAG: cupin domain-containing protein [Deltaproteobacteria bacterium]|nr:cupin domain-containing protein [Deltaproteobacteria bacterium]